MKIDLRFTRRRAMALAATTLLLTIVPADAPAKEHVVPVPCRLHPTHVVNPGCVPALTDSVTGYDIAYPDLVPNVTQVKVDRPIFWDFEKEEIGYGPPELAFDTHAQNLGYVPLDLLADNPTELAGSTVSQCVAWTTDLVCRERRRVGGFTWHEEHGHFHFEDFGHYEFRRVLPDNTPDRSPAGLVDISEKVSFCLIDSDQVRPDSRPVARYRQCDATNQGISPGWTDIYGYGLDGQQFPLTGVPDGRYALIIDMDTSNHVYETDDVHNRVEVIVDVTTSPDSATIVSVTHP